MINDEVLNYTTILNLLSGQVPFAFSRWGDGEWACVSGRKGHNCDGVKYSPQLGSELRKILNIKRSAPYYLGCQTLIDFSLDSAAHYDQDWVDADVLHRQSMDCGLREMIRVLHWTCHVVYVGNEDHRTLPFIDEFISVHRSKAWDNRANTMNQIARSLDKKTKVYLFSAGLASNVFIHQARIMNPRNIYLDVGSVFDPHAGVESRRYHKADGHRARCQHALTKACL